MAKSKSRSKRWFEAVENAKSAFQTIQDEGSNLADAMQELHDVQQEYQDWLDNLPENLQSSALGEKLEAVTNIDIESLTSDPLSDWPSLEGVLDEAEGADLPMGFGRD